MRGLKRFVVAVFVLAACARQAPPPGGPPRLLPPALVSQFPDSGVAPCDFRGDAEFVFDEVTSEGAQANFGLGTGDLEQLILLSPDTLVPRVEWHRNRITVRPRGGWKPNQTYRVEMLPGVSDLLRNVSKVGHVISFATCGPAPTRILSGRAVDWSQQRGANAALIQAYHMPDSARYTTQADTTGRFRFAGLPAGEYLVVAVVESKRDHRRQPNEPWDSVRASATSDTVGEIWAYARDTIPPKIRSVLRRDSQSVSVTFDKAIDPTLRVDSTNVHVRLLVDKDSVSIGTVSAIPLSVFDSLEKIVKARTDSAVKDTTKKDSIAVRRDSVTRDSLARVTAARARAAARSGQANQPPADLPKQKRPKLEMTLVIRTFGRVEEGKRYIVDIDSVRTPDGRRAPHLRQPFAVPAAPKAAAPKTKADSLRADSLKADSAKAKPGGTPPIKTR